MSLSFFDYVDQQATAVEPGSLGATAVSYWQDWQCQRPIDGGVAFEANLRKLPLDGSLVSLAHLDQFLLSLQAHLGGDISEATHQPKLRKLLVFISFYSGWVLAYHASQLAFSNPSHPQVQASWLSRQQLLAAYPIFQHMMGNDSSYALALSLLPPDKTAFSSAVFSASLYFPLLTIMARLSPQPDDKPHTHLSQFGHLGDSLFDGVNLLLAQWRQPHLTQVGASQPPTSSAFDTSLPPGNDLTDPHQLPAYLLSDLNNPLMERKTASTAPLSSVAQVRPKITYQSYVVANLAHASMTDANNQPDEQWLSDSPRHQPFTLGLVPPGDQNMPVSRGTSVAPPSLSAKTAKPSSLAQAHFNSAKREAKRQQQLLAKQQAELEAIAEAEAQANHQAAIVQALANPQLHEGLRHQAKSLVDVVVKPQDSFGELEQDLAFINFATPITPEAQTAYQHAVEIWQQYYLQKPVDPGALNTAYAVIAAQADAMLPDAMLRHALMYLRGENAIGIQQDRQQGLDLVKAAAKRQDNRAEKLLSKLYFSGELVEMDTQQGKFWLAQAAEHGHAAAQQLQHSFAMASQLSTTRQADDSYIKKLLIGTAILVCMLLGIFFVVKI